ncbi:MAG: sigma 54-interacting transcriptional regulator, partial [Acidobacteriia bacterium]|nr:sigma 54-interacting transcriptional regulator [Terriglobia bacterium]
GSNDKVKVDVRVIAATNRDLESSYRAGTFRKDLYFRLNVVTVHVPPLRERRSDMVPLVRSFLARYAPDENVLVTPPAMNCLFQYDWPGNVRELENCVERAIALGNHRTIDLQDLPASIRAAGSAVPVPPAETLAPSAPAIGPGSTDLEDIERQTIQSVFQQVGGDKARAGKMLGISRATLYRKLKRYHIEAGESVGSTAVSAAQNN